ncbi:MAG: hypothetical protein JJU36_05980 [Phycisphaeraceae bacterium]|nr:hypothetical protein [Phycisphaeraceae bacterium]
MNRLNAHILLAALLILTMLVGLGLERRSSLRAAPEERGQRTLAHWIGGGFSIDSIRALTVINPDAPTPEWSLIRQGGRWHEQRPGWYPVETLLIQSLLEALAETELLLSPEALSESIGTAGPDGETPGIELVVAWGDEQSRTLRLHHTGLGGWMYLAKAGAAPWLADGRLLEILDDLDAGAWRARRLGGLGQPSVARLDRLRYEDGVDELELERTLEGWRISGTEDRIDRNQLALWLDELHGLAALAFYRDAVEPDDARRLGLDESARRITWWWLDASAQGAEAERKLQVRFGPKVETPGGVWKIGMARLDDHPWSPPFFVAAEPVERLASRLGSVRDVRLIQERVRDLIRIEVADRNRPGFGMNRSEHGWRFTEPGTWGSVDVTAFLNLMRVLDEGRARGFAPWPADAEPDRTLRLFFTGRTQPQVLELLAADLEGQGPAVGWLLRRPGEGSGRVVSAELAAALLAGAGEFRARRLGLSPEQWLAMTIHQPGRPDSGRDDREWRFHREAMDGQPASWRLADEGRLDDEAMAALLRELGDLEVEQWLERSPTPAEDWLKLHWVDARGDGRTLRLDPEDRRARLDGEPMGFVVPPSLVQALRREFRDPTAMPWTVLELRRVEVLDRDDQMAAIRIDGRSVNIAEGPEVPLARIRRLLDAGSPLRVERWSDPPQRPMDVVRTIRFISRTDRTIEVELLEDLSWARIGGAYAILRPGDDERLREPWFESPGRD